MINSQRTFWRADVALALGLFGLALWLGTDRLTHFVTADEHNWVYRSGVFLNAFLRGDWPGTSVWLTPGVTTTWLASAGLAGHYRLAQADINQPFLDWLLSFNRNRVDLNELLALRRAMALFLATMVVVIFGLARKLWSRPLAGLGALLILLDPHLLSVSRIIGHDAPATLFIITSLLSFFYARRQAASGWRAIGWFGLSGVLAGLGVLSKAPALFLVPFAGLIALADLWQRRGSIGRWAIFLLVWGGALWLTFIVVWPAAWVSPWGQTWAVISNAFLSSAGLEDADIQPYWATPDLGLFYYAINGVFKLNPFVFAGVIVAAASGIRNFTRQRNVTGLLNSEILWLLLFALLFGLFMSLGVKQSPRYILPAFPALSFVAAWGWLKIAPARWQPLEVGLLASASLLLALAYAPYYFSYYSPLLGGAITAPRLLRIGWGEGMDEAGRWLNNRPDAAASRVGVRYKVSTYPFFGGELATPIDEELDYVVFYIKQSQSGYPAPEILAYFADQGALHRVVINGIDYAQIYAGPAMQPVDSGGRSDLPIAYRPGTIYAPISQTLTVDLLWPAEFSRSEPVTLSLVSAGETLRLDSAAEIREQAPGVKVSRHTFNLPPETPRDTYTLSIGDARLGQIKARLMTIPADFAPLDFAAQSVKLVGIRQQQTGRQLQVDLAWQAWPKATNDFTVFVQLLDEAGQRVAGVDVAPQSGFTALDRKEIMIASNTLPLPENLAGGKYKLLIGLYYFAGDELITVGAATLDEPIGIQ